MGRYGHSTPHERRALAGFEGSHYQTPKKELSPLACAQVQRGNCRLTGACGSSSPRVMRRKLLYDGGGSNPTSSSKTLTKMKTALILLGLTSLPWAQSVYTDSPFGEKIDLLEALGVKHPRSAVKRTKGYCSSKNPDNSQQDYSYQLLKKHQISVPTSSIFVEEDGTQRPFPEEFSIVSVLKLKKQKKNSNLFTVWDSNGRQQLGLNIGKDHRLFYQDDEMSGT